MYAIGADHRGFAHKEYIKKAMSEYQWSDVGAYDDYRSDYPIFAEAASKKVMRGEVQAAVLLCGTGVGMAILANRYQGIFAALAWNSEVALQSKEHDGANILVIPADFVTKEESVAMIRTWMAAKPLGGRYAERRSLVDELTVQ